MSTNIDITKLDLTVDEMARVTNACDGPELLMEAAQCAWEHALDCLGSTNPKADAHVAIVKEWMEGAGCAEVRWQCRDLARPICLAYAIMGENAGSEMGSYDWDFVPWFMRECVDWENHQAVTLRGDWLEIVRKERDVLEKRAAERHAEFQARHGVVQDIAPPAPKAWLYRAEVQLLIEASGGEAALGQVEDMLDRLESDTDLIDWNFLTIGEHVIKPYRVRLIDTDAANTVRNTVWAKEE